MILLYPNIQNFMRRFLSLCVVYAMLLPTVVHALVLVTESDHTFELMLSDKHEESEKEEQQEEDSKNEKIEMQVLSPDKMNYTFAAEQDLLNRVEAVSNYIIEIPIPPPELG